MAPQGTARRLGRGLLAGEISAVAGTGAGALVFAGTAPEPQTGLGALASPTSWAFSAAGPPTATVPVLVVVVATLVAGAIAGLATLGHRALGPVPFVLAGVAAWFWPPTAAAGSGPAIVVGVVVAGLLVVLTSAAGPRSRAAGSQQPPGPGAGRMQRRTFLASGVVAVALAAAGTATLLRKKGALPPSARPVGPTAAAPAQPRGTVVNVRDMGAVGDGKADDTAAFRRAVDAATRSGGTVYLPPGTFRLVTASPIALSGILVSGEQDRSVIEVAAPTPRPSSAVATFLVGGTGTQLDGVTVRRVDDFEVVLLGMDRSSGFSLTRSTIVDAVSSATSTACFGLKLPDAGSVDDTTITDSTFEGLHYGLFQTNQSAAVTRRFRVERCAFRGGKHTDLEFNSPMGTTESVGVIGCAFQDNESDGFGVGLANVSDVDIRSNWFENYAQEAVHTEDFTSSVTVQDNEFVACGLRRNSTVQVLSNSSDIRVVDNAFRNTVNQAEVYAMTAQAGGVGTNTSGRPIAPPSSILVERNLFECSSSVTPLYLEAVGGARVDGNVVSSPTPVTAAQAFVVYGNAQVTMGRNTVNGGVY